MSTLLNIQILSKSDSAKEKIVFFRDDSWTIDTQLHLLHRVHELVEMTRPYGRKLCINLEIESEEADYVIGLIKKKSRKVADISSHNLSKREIEIIGLLMQGLSSEEISEKLFISYETVKSHRKHILEKTGAKNTAALINYYHQTFFEK
jgi:DNA-binding CsgD family transcriptional regulator